MPFYRVTGEDVYDLFGKYGSIRQVRLGREGKAKGTAFVVYEDVMDVRLVSSHSLALSRRAVLIRDLDDNAHRPRTLTTTSTVSTCKIGTSSVRLPLPLRLSLFRSYSLLPLSTVLYHKVAKETAKLDLARREKELNELKQKHNIPDKQE